MTHDSVERDGRRVTALVVDDDAASLSLSSISYIVSKSIKAPRLIIKIQGDEAERFLRPLPSEQDDWLVGAISCDAG